MWRRGPPHTKPGAIPSASRFLLSASRSAYTFIMLRRTCVFILCVCDVSGVRCPSGVRALPVVRVCPAGWTRWTDLSWCARRRAQHDRWDERRDLFRLVELDVAAAALSWLRLSEPGVARAQPMASVCEMVQMVHGGAWAAEAARPIPVYFFVVCCRPGGGGSL